MYRVVKLINVIDCFITERLLFVLCAEASLAKYMGHKISRIDAFSSPPLFPYFSGFVICALILYEIFWLIS